MHVCWLMKCSLPGSACAQVAFFFPNRTLLCLFAGVRGLIKLIRLTWILLQSCSDLEGECLLSYSHLHHSLFQWITIVMSERSVLDERVCVRERQGSSGKAALCLALLKGGELLWNRSTVNCFTPFHFSFIFFLFSCSMLTQEKQCMQGKLRLCSRVFVVLCLLCGIIRCLYHALNKIFFFKSLSLLYKFIVSDL